MGERGELGSAAPAVGSGGQHLGGKGKMLPQACLILLQAAEAGGSAVQVPGAA